jgi:enterochelin esterase-like enzyme
MRLLLLGLTVILLLGGCSLLPQEAALPTRAPTLEAVVTATQAATATPPPATPTLAPTATPTPEPTCAEMTGQLERVEIDSLALGEALALQIYLPPCYGFDPAQRYPVLYLLHGQGGSEAQWTGFGLAETADRLIAAGEMRPLMVVMPNERQYLQDVAEAQFPNALLEELLPYIDEHYATCDERACRSIGGLSRGAAWAARLGFEHWKLFGSIGLHSLPGFIGDPNRLPVWLADLPDGEYPRVWLDIGVDDRYLKPASDFEALLTRFRLPHEWHLLPGGHEDAYWRANLESYLRWYGKAPK